MSWYNFVLTQNHSVLCLFIFPITYSQSFKIILKATKQTIALHVLSMMEFAAGP